MKRLDPQTRLLIRQKELRVLADLEKWTREKDAGMDESADSQLGLVRQSAAELLDLRKALKLRSYEGEAMDFKGPEKH